MDDIIKDIRNKIEQNRFPNEASISQGIVLRLIRALGWDVDDTDVVWPEFTIGSQRADFALCRPAGKPVVLVEVKQPGTMTLNAEEQLSAYAYQQGVPLVVLTSGTDWHFFAPYGLGPFSDRRIYRLDILERATDEIESRLKRYLSYDNWQSGQAVISVQDDLREMLGNQETRRQLPMAWKALLAEPEPQLVEIVAAQLEKQTGSEPQKSEIVNFLKNQILSIREFGEQQPPRKFPIAEEKKPARRIKSVQQGPIKLWIEDSEVPVKSSRDRMVKVVAFAASKDPSVLERVYQSSRSGRRTDIAPTPESLYPNNPEFARETNHWREIPSSPGWFIDVNKGNVQMTAFIQRVCELAGLEFGKDIRIN